MKYTLFVLLFIGYLFAEYNEGLDTTKSNGNGLDNTFQIDFEKIVALDNAKIALYQVKYWEFICEWQYANHTFDEICVIPSQFDNIATDEITTKDIVNTRIVIKRNDGTFVKVHILEQLSGMKYAYRYGINTEPGGNLIADDYDKSKKYPPQNLAVQMLYITEHNGIKGLAYLKWDPPLPNDNTLEHYEIYHIDFRDIDTTQPINLNEWILIDQTTQTYGEWWGEGDYKNNYINVIAIYEEGPSEPLQGWTLLADDNTIINHGASKDILRDHMSIKENRIYFNLSRTCKTDLSIFTVHGKKLTTLLHGFYTGGTHVTLFDLGKYGSGIYYVKLKTDMGTVVKKVAVVG